MRAGQVPLPVAACLALMLFTFAALPVLAQAPGTPISTTVLEPAVPQAGSGISGDLATPSPDVPVDDVPVLIDAGEGTAATRDDRAAPPLAPEATTETDDPRARQAPGPDMADTVATIGTGDTAGRDARPQDPQGAPAQTTQFDPPASAPASPTSAAATTARALLTGLWREAVATGETVLGFEAWLGEALGRDSPATRKRVEIPADQAGRTRLVSERWRTRAGPVALGAAGRVVTTFGSAIPTAFCAPLTVCYIELEPGEFLTSTPSWGDTVRWQVLVKSQGRDPVTVVIEVKPAEDAQLTNLVIPTDRRLYTINLVNDPEVHTPILSFLYPDSAARKVTEEIAAREAREAQAKAAQEQRRAEAASARAADLKRTGVQTATGNVSADRLDFGFRVDGKAAFRPVRVFADGRKTYIDLHPDFRGALPAIVAGPGEENAALNTRVTQGGTRLVADRVISDIWLQSGKKRVRIRRAAR